MNKYWLGAAFNRDPVDIMWQIVCIVHLASCSSSVCVHYPGLVIFGIGIDDRGKVA